MWRPAAAWQALLQSPLQLLLLSSLCTRELFFWRGAFSGSTCLGWVTLLSPDYFWLSLPNGMLRRGRVDDPDA